MNFFKHFEQKFIVILLALLFVFSVFSLMISPAWAEDAVKADNKKTQSKAPAKTATKKKSGEVKELSGISIIGNKEAPKSLYIVPWKNSEVGVRSSLTSGLLDESMRPIDKEVFIRELDFYELSHSK